MPTLSDFHARALTGDEVDLSRYRGKVALVVNTASRCGLTPQYQGLEELYRRYADDGLVVLGFPCDQFGHQEPGDASEIQEFCELNFGVSFPMFAKVEVNGEGSHPLYRWLRAERSGAEGDALEWNFTKFLLARDGTVLARFAPGTTPDALAGDIETALAA